MKPISTKEFDKANDNYAKKLGFKDHKDKLVFNNIHMSLWYQNHPGYSCFEKEFIDEYIKDREAYKNKKDIGVMALLYIDFKYEH